MEDAYRSRDPRRGLGRRSDAPLPPRLDLGLDDQSFNGSASPTLESRANARSHSASRAGLKLEVPSSPTSSSSNPLGRFRKSALKVDVSKSPTRGLSESQKLLSHLLDRLENQDLAPDLLQRAAASARESSAQRGGGKTKVAKLGQVVIAAAQTGLSVAQTGATVGSKGTGGGISGGEDRWEDTVEQKTDNSSLDETYDLVEQTRSLLLIAHKQGVDILSCDSPCGQTSTPDSTHRRQNMVGRLASLASPSSPTQPGQRSRIGPRTSYMAATESSDASLRSRLLSIISQLVGSNCAFPLNQYRPSRPPQSLQAACLDILTCIYDNGDLPVRLRAIDILLEGFISMADGMAEKICHWLEGRVAELLTLLAEERLPAAFASDSSANQSSLERKPQIPSFAFSAASDTPSTGDTRGWKQYSPISQSPIWRHGDAKVAGVSVPFQGPSRLSDESAAISDLVLRLLTALIMTIDADNPTLTMSYRYHRLLGTILNGKADASLDLLQIIAWGPSKVQKIAISILNTFYVKSIGHNSFARRIPAGTYDTLRLKWETGHAKAMGEDEAEGHHYLPWRISHRDDPGIEDGRCIVCGVDVHGFCVRCTLCGDVKHLQCLDHPDYMVDYHIVDSAGNVPRVTIKYSKAIPRLDEIVLNGLGPNGDDQSTIRRVGSHDLHLVNLLTFTLCAACRDPLWGNTKQAYGCLDGCQRFFHPGCLHSLGKSGPVCAGPTSQTTLTGRFEIGIANLDASYAKHVRPTLHVDESSHRSYDETAVLYGSLWIQYNLLKNGIACGSIIINGATGETLGSDPLQLRSVLKIYEEDLRDRQSQASTAITDFAHVSDQSEVLGQGYLFSTRYLSYCSALLRAPRGTPSNDASLLAPDQAVSEQPSGAEDQEVYGVLELPTICEGLGVDFNINSAYARSVILEQLAALGLLNLPRRMSIGEAEVSKPANLASFDIPMLVDSSPSVELLIQVIETMLGNLDLALVETGLRLVRSRAWPSVMCSPYALERVGRALVSWVMSQEYDVHTIVKEYASKNRRIPGVRSDRQGSQTSVSAYQRTRQQLQTRYASPWLKALHQQDPILYALVVYEECKSLDQDKLIMSTVSGIASQALDRMVIMSDQNLLFGIHVQLVIAWLEDLGVHARQDVSYRTLSRLLTRAAEAASTSKAQISDIWLEIATMAANDPQDLDRACLWLRVLAVSGVEIPWETLQHMVDSQLASFSGWQSTLDIVIALESNTASTEPKAFADLCSNLVTSLAGTILDSLEEEVDASDVLTPALRATLKAYGVSQIDLKDSVFSSQNGQSAEPTSRQKKLVPSIHLIEIDSAFLTSLASLIGERMSLALPILDFLSLLFTKASSAANVDGFLYDNAVTLYPSLWSLSTNGRQRQIRLEILLRLLSVNPRPMEALIKAAFHGGPDGRRMMKDNILAFVLGLNEPNSIPDHLSSLVGIVLLFMEALLDPANISPADQAIRDGLLPSHLQVFSSIFEAHLTQGTDESRLVLSCRLRPLVDSFPNWPILAWSAIEEILVDNSNSITQMTQAKSTQSTSALKDAQVLRAELLGLSLDMIAAGIDIPWSSIQRIQQHVSEACEPSWTVDSPSTVMTLLAALRRVLDSPKRLSVRNPNSSSDVNSYALVGALFVTVAIGFSRELPTFGYTEKRLVLDIIFAIFFKHSTAPIDLAALAAIQDIADFVATETNVDLRLLGLQIIQVASDRMNKDSIIRAIPYVVCTLSGTLVKETENGNGGKVTEGVRSLLLSLTTSFVTPKLYVQLFKTAAANVTVIDDPTALGKAMVMLDDHKTTKGSTSGQFTTNLAFLDLSDVFKRGRSTLADVLSSLELFVQSIQALISHETVVEFGTFISRLGKHVAEWNPDEFDPNPFLRTCGRVLSLAPNEAAMTLLHQTSTFLLLSLARFNVEHGAITQLAIASQAVSEVSKAEDTIQTVIFEGLGSALNGQQVAMSTLHVLLRYLVDSALVGSRDSLESTKQELILASTWSCANILYRRHPVFAEASSDERHAFMVLSQAAAVLIQAEIMVPGSVGSALRSTENEASSAQLGFFAHILSASLDVIMGSARNGLRSIYPNIARSTALCLRASADLLTVQDATGSGADYLSTVFIVFRLASLATQDGAAVEGGDGVTDSMEIFWSRIWPDLYRLLSLSLESTCINGPLRAVAHAVTLDMVIYLGAAHPAISTAHASALTHTLRLMHRHQAYTSSGHSVGKFMRAEVALETVGLVDTAIDRAGIIKTTREDLYASERLRNLRQLR